jgi:hypothetical protein
MKALTNNEKSWGPFQTVVEEDDKWICNGTIYPKSVVGNCTVFTVTEDWISPEQELQQKDNYNKAQKKAREEAYKTESDSLFFQVQRGDIENQVWLDKVSEIKQRFPYKV